ncbi:calcium-binding protein CP1-like [Telopea speciosissima]|uniref:calcium-binding protein CP1-like n=1 Tax=Telopea speciosissima TaxID=54955 RepID=UPI001CC33603|nr:calcium-binding protein CP1-like [Telopea speciosissima]
MCPSGRSRNPNLEYSAMVSSDFRPAFDFLDVDRDGKISPDDLRRFYKRFSSSSSSSSNVACEEDISSMISVADSNKDGLVEYDEFERVLFQVPSQSQPPRDDDNSVMQDMFKVMDRDGDGKVGFHDLKIYMKWAGLQASDEDVRAMIKLGGGDDHDGISFEGLLKILNFDLIGK